MARLLVVLGLLAVAFSDARGQPDAPPRFEFRAGGLVGATRLDVAGTHYSITPAIGPGFAIRVVSFDSAKWNARLIGEVAWGVGAHAAGPGGYETTHSGNLTFVSVDVMRRLYRIRMASFFATFGVGVRNNVGADYVCNVLDSGGSVGCRPKFPLAKRLAETRMSLRAQGGPFSLETVLYSGRESGSWQSLALVEVGIAVR